VGSFVSPIFAGVTWILFWRQAPEAAVRATGAAAILVSLLAPLAIIVATLTAVVCAIKQVPWDRRTSLAFWLGWFGLGVNLVGVGQLLIGI
jgi:hypothetical protein